MKVTIEQHVGKSLASGAAVELPQFRVRVDGVHAGFVPWGGGIVSLTRRFSPIARKEIEEQVSLLVDQKVKSKQGPEVPEGFYESQEDDDDDFDT